jgi:DNA-binding HxlR family transcriptional regulator
MSSQRLATTARTDAEQSLDRPLFADPEAALHITRDIVGRKWHPVLLFHLSRDEPLGFSDLKERADGISSKMLSESLSDLEEWGLVTRDLVDDQPVRVEYAVADRGETLLPVIEAMVDWGMETAE